MDNPLTVEEIDGILDAACDNIDDLEPGMPNYTILIDENLLIKNLIVSLKLGYAALAEMPCHKCGGRGFSGYRFISADSPDEQERVPCTNCVDFPCSAKGHFAKDWKDAYNKVVNP